MSRSSSSSLSRELSLSSLLLRLRLLFPLAPFFSIPLSLSLSLPSLSLALSLRLFLAIDRERNERKERRGERREETRLFSRLDCSGCYGSRLTGTIWGERDDINSPNLSKLKAWYPTILMELGAEISWAWSSFQAPRICWGWFKFWDKKFRVINILLYASSIG